MGSRDTFVSILLPAATASQEQFIDIVQNIAGVASTAA